MKLNFYFDIIQKLKGSIFMLSISVEKLKQYFLKIKQDNNLTNDEAIDLLLEKIADYYLNTYCKEKSQKQKTNFNSFNYYIKKSLSFSFSFSLLNNLSNSLVATSNSIFKFLIAHLTFSCILYFTLALSKWLCTISFLE